MNLRGNTCLAIQTYFAFGRRHHGGITFMTPDLIVIRESSVMNCDIIWIRLNSDRGWSSMEFVSTEQPVERDEA